MEWKANLRSVSDGPVYCFDAVWIMDSYETPFDVRCIWREGKWIVLDPIGQEVVAKSDLWHVAVKACEPLVPKTNDYFI